MSNMSYCRFQNTLGDLRDCVENIDDQELSKEEQRARDSMILLIVQTAEDYQDEADLIREKRAKAAHGG